jgi:hypothetical protein
MDFTLTTYKKLLNSLLSQGFLFQPYATFIQTNESTFNRKRVLLRHDVDLLPQNSLCFAQIQEEHKIFGTYYFRAVPESWDEGIIKEIAAMGHEIGYHYENLTTCKGNIDAAFEDFKRNLEALRKIADVTTICMHGSPASPYDSKDIWKKYDYRTLGIIAEPYFDVDFSKVFYLTDTGRRWDGYKVSVRDKIPGHQERWNEQGLTWHTTPELIQAIEQGKLPEQVMMTFHPQRWTDNKLLWAKELLLQKAKNTVKSFIVNR